MIRGIDATIMFQERMRCHGESLHKDLDRLQHPILVFFRIWYNGLRAKNLVGNLPADIDHWNADDIYMGAALTPWVYGLAPFVLLFVSGLVCWFLSRRRKAS